MATYTNLDNEIFARNALEGFVKELLPISAFSTSFSPDPVQKGNGVLVPLIGSITATTFSAYNICGGTMTVVTVTINKHKIAQVGQSDLTEAGSSMAQLEKFAFQQGAGLATLVLQDILSVVTAGGANFPLYTAVSSTAIDLAQIRAARLALNQANCPRQSRNLILDCVPFDTLLGVTNFIQAHIYGDRTLQTGSIPRALGMDMFEVNSLFSGASVMGFAAHARAIAVAMRYLQPQAGHKYADARPVTDPNTGLTLGLRDHYDENTGTRYLNLEANYGYTTGITAGGYAFARLD